jgi:hypothetical protein
MTFPRASQSLSRFTVLDLPVRPAPTCVRQLVMAQEKGKSQRELASHHLIKPPEAALMRTA